MDKGKLILNKKEEILKEISGIDEFEQIKFFFVNRYVWEVFDVGVGIGNRRMNRQIADLGYLHLIIPSSKVGEKDNCVILSDDDDGMRKEDFKKEYWDPLFRIYQKNKEDYKHTCKVMYEAVKSEVGGI